jgi:hypothetical protein
MTISVFLAILIWMRPSPELPAKALLSGSQPDALSALQASSAETASQDSKGKRVMYLVPPSQTDPNIKDTDGDNLLLFDQKVAPNANLLVFIGGTARYKKADQQGFDVSQAFAKSFPAPFLNLAADLGYRVISLDFKYQPAGTAVCHSVQDRTCYDRFREKKVFGSGIMAEVPTTPAESIVNRLTKLLQYVARQYPEQGWEGYLVNGQPNWSRIALTGHSQGAGLAAFLPNAGTACITRKKTKRYGWNEPTRRFEFPTTTFAWKSWNLAIRRESRATATTSA